MDRAAPQVRRREARRRRHANVFALVLFQLYKLVQHIRLTAPCRTGQQYVMPLIHNGERQGLLHSFYYTVLSRSLVTLTGQVRYTASMSKPEYKQGVFGRLYDIACTEEAFRLGYIDTVEVERKLGIGERKDLAPFLEVEDPDRRDYLMDILDTSASVAYSFSAERIVDGLDNTLLNYVVTTSLEQSVIGIPPAFEPDISPKKLLKVQRDRGLFLSAVAATSYHLRSDNPDEIVATHTYALKHRNKTLACIDSDVYTDRGCEGESVAIPSPEAGEFDTHLFVPEPIHHERIADNDRIDVHLAFRALTLANSDNDGESALFREDLVERVEAMLDMMQLKRRLVV